MKQAVCRILVLTLAPALLAPPARADDLTIGKMNYKDVEIRDVSDGRIGFMFYQRLVHKPLAEVSAVRLENDATFNKAEDFLAKEKFDQAIALYAAAGSAAKGKWRGALIDYRLALAVVGKLHSPMGSAASGEPASSSGKPADPLASADAFAALLESGPQPPPGMAGSKAANLPPNLARVWRQYSAKHAIWEKKVILLRGKKAIWELIFNSAVPIQEFLTSDKARRPARRSTGSRARSSKQPQGTPPTWATGFVVRATSTGGVTVLANVLSAKAEGLDSIKPSEIVRITGRIRRDLEATAAGYELYLSAAVVKPTGKIAKPKDDQAGKKTKSTR